ncbi:APC amino acid permease [Dacryopinax primogenitus]|uniref:APC amino acid permease n=1 Tax=Dacryopinax primogenitus (strain DJM 731) TaxID=1858805 RepID=M5FPP9_DACPD|nr:APC amino acid permease [Dacryopinax primogenitus]EJT98695.1 APC amino acid permease [Dacryopinax primogenitus]
MTILQILGLKEAERHRVADEKLLASLGYKQEFKRAFTPLETFGIALSIIGGLSSLSSVLIYAVPYGGPVSMVWSWAICSFFIMAIALALAELGSGAPTSGGLYFWTYSFSSPRWRTVLCWIVGYTNSIANIAGVASADWGCAVMIMAGASIGSGGTFTTTLGQTFAVVVLIILSQAVLACLATAVLARLQSVYVLVNLALSIAVIIALPAATPSELRNPASYVFGNFTNLSSWSNPGFAYMLGWLAPSWSVSGFDGCVHISEEASNAAIAVPWGMVSAVFACCTLGWAINVAMAFCMGTDLESIVNSPIGQPMATIFNNSFGQRSTLAVWSFVIIGQYMIGSSQIMSSSRQIFAFARDGALPLSPYLARMNSRTHVPVNAVLLCAVGGIALCALAFAGAAAIGAIFALAVVAYYITWSVPIVCRFAFKNDFQPGPFTLGRFGLPVAVVAVAYMTFMEIIFLFPGGSGPDPTDMNYCVVVLGGILFLSLAYYYFPKYGGYSWFKGPVPNVDPEPARDQERSETLSTSSEGKKDAGGEVAVQAVGGVE